MAQRVSLKSVKLGLTFCAPEIQLWSVLLRNFLLCSIVFPTTLYGKVIVINTKQIACQKPGSLTLLAAEVATSSQRLMRLLGPLIRQSGLVGGIAAISVSQPKFNSGLASFTLASALSSLGGRGWEPHLALMEASWTTVLQTALVLGIWSTATVTVKRQGPKTSFGEKLVSMILAFAIGCVGTVVGSLLGVKVTSLFPSSSSEVSRAVWPIAASCLTASYIGGTANFFETANLLGANKKDAVQRTLNLVAGADILLMVLYFGVLLAFRVAVVDEQRPIFNFLRFDGEGSKQVEEFIINTEEAPKQNQRLALSITLAILVSILASRAQRIIPISVSFPGFSVMVSVLTAVLISSSPLLRQFLAGPRYLFVANEFAMAVFYACIGLGCKLHDTAAIGPGVVALMLFTLAGHFGTILAGSCLLNKIILKFRSKFHQFPLQPINVDTLVIASNACVGGATTAASMAASFQRADPSLVFLGSLAGIVGYLIGTPIGLAFARMLNVAPVC